MRRPKLLVHFFSFLFLLWQFIVFSTVLAQQPFHQQADHYLRARLIPESSSVEVYDSLVYTHRAPRPLDTFYLHLWPMAYSHGRTALARQKAEQGNTHLKYKKSVRGRMEFSRFEQEGAPVTYSLWNKNPDVVWWQLPRPLKSGEKTTLVFRYRLRMPSTQISRMGVQEEDYFVTQWFPKPAVYDAEGWHPMPYLDQGEFYCEWGTYRVELDVPSRYVVAASGVPDPEYLYQLEQWAATPDPAQRDSAGRRIVRYVAERVHDFAWCASPHWRVEKNNFNDPVSGEEKTLFAYYKPDHSALWKGITDAGRRTLSYFAAYFGQAYPFPFYNIVDGSLAAGGGMEYPQLTIIGPVSSREALEEVVHHEMGHMWFQGILANNERDHPWLDEGINSYFDNRFVRDTRGEEVGRLSMQLSPLRIKLGDLEKGFQTAEYLLWNTMVRLGAFQGPARTTSARYSTVNYGLSVYQHTAYLFRYLEEVLGQATLDSAMRLYYRRCAFSHVRPSDLQNALEEASGRDLDWFFQHLLRDNGAQNFRLRRKDLSWDLQARRLGVQLRFARVAMPVPVYIGPEYDREKTQWVLWPGQDGVARAFTESLPFEPKNLMLGRPFTLPDWSYRDNFYHLSHGKWKRKKGFLVMPVLNLAQLLRPGIALLPVYGWNNNNKSMLGILAHNYGVPLARLQYYVMPLFSFNPHGWAGSAGLEYRIYGRRDFRAIRISLDVHRYAYDYTTRPLNYLKASAGARIPLTDPRRTWRASMEVRAEYFCVAWKQHLWQPQMGLNDRNRYFRTLTELRLERNSRWNPLRHSLYIEGISEHSEKNSFRQTGSAFKIFQEFKASIYFIPKYRGLHIRFFQGGFPWTPDTRINVNYKLSSWPGFYDYTYSGIFWDRSATRGFLSRQMTEADGGFHQFVNYQSLQYLAALNLRLDLPRPLPVRVFGDVGYTSTAYPTGAGKNVHLFWSAGLTLHLLDEALAVHFPLFFSSAIRRSLEINNVQGLDRQIRFVVDFHRLNPRRLTEWFRFLN